MASRPGIKRLGSASALREWVERGISLSDAQRRATLERARSYQLANLEKQGRLIDKACEDRRDFERARTVRDAILGVPDRLAAELAAETDAARLHAKLSEELRKALGALAELLDHDPPADVLPAGDGDGDAEE